MADCQINRSMLPVKFTYFFELGAVASLLPYLNVYMSSIGLTYSELSIIYGTSPFVTAILRTLIGMLADKLQKHKLVLLLCCVFSGLFHGLLLVTPKAPGPPEGSYPICDVPVKLSCGTTGSTIEHCTAPTNLICDNGNCTNLDPFSNATQCVVKCDLDAASVSYCVTASAPVLSMSSCTANQTVTPDLSLIQDSLVPTHQAGYSTSPNCSQYTLSEFSYSGQYYYSLICPSVVSMETCHMTCDGFSPVDLHSSGSCVQNEAHTFGKTFWFFFSFFLIGQIFFAPIFSMIDALVYTYLGKQGGQWGQQRLWGTVGFAVFAIISGFVMDAFADLGVTKSFDNFLFAFILFAVLSIAGGLMVLVYKITETVTSTTLLTNLRELLSRFPVIVLLINIFMFGLYTGIIETFLFVRLGELGATKLLMGICMLINCLPEIVILMFAGVIIKKIGIFGNLCIVYSAYSVRLFAYAFLTNPWFSLMVEPLHSITFGLMYATVTFHGNEITPPGMRGTIQSVIGALYFGFGKGSGSIISGQIYQHYGAQSTFLGFGISGVVCLTIFILIHIFCLRKIKKEPIDESAEPEVEVKEVEMQMLTSGDQKKHNLHDEDDRGDHPDTNHTDKLTTDATDETDGLVNKEPQAV